MKFKSPDFGCEPETNAITTRKHRPKQTGSVMIVTLILMVSFGALATASLTMVVSENKKISARHYARKVRLQAQGELEIAKNIVNAASYDTGMQNTALLGALAATDQMIPKTNVRVERIGTTEYYVLRAQATEHGMTKSAEAIVRQVSPASANNLMVIDHPVGVSGAPRGAIHTNKYIDFYFPGGNYRDQVTANGGFNFVAGADKDNTTFSGASNPNAPVVDPLKDVDFDSLWAKADTLAVTDNFISEIQFKGDKAQIKLFKPAYTKTVPATRTKTVFSHYEYETYTKNVPVYKTTTYWKDEPVYTRENYTVIESKPNYRYRDVTYTETKNVYGEKTVSYTVDVPVYGTKTVAIKEWVDKWISFTGGGTSSSGGTVGSKGRAAGYWKKVQVTKNIPESYVTGYKKETRTRTDRVKTGTEEITKTKSERYIDGYRDVTVNKHRHVPNGTVSVKRTKKKKVGYKAVTRTRRVKKYKTVTETYMKTTEYKETLVRTKTVDATGTMYLKGDVRKIAGQMNGRVSLITSGSVKLTGDLQYIDGSGRTRMLNGKDYTQPYTQNPDYDGNSLLAIMAKGDILYSKDAPRDLEINASLISADGSVKFEGIGVSTDGTDVWSEYDSAQVLRSLRRLGGIVSRKRPIATFIDEKGYITAGFEYGESIMDQNLILSSGTNAPPPFMFESAVPTWIMNTAGMRMGIQ